MRAASGAHAGMWGGGRAPSYTAGGMVLDVGVDERGAQIPRREEGQSDRGNSFLLARLYGGRVGWDSGRGGRDSGHPGVWAVKHMWEGGGGRKEEGGRRKRRRRSRRTKRRRMRREKKSNQTTPT